MKPCNKKRCWLALVVTGLVLTSLVPLCRHAYDTTLLLAELAHIHLPLPDFRPTFDRREITYRTNQRQHTADLYVPEHRARAGMILVPGAAEGGRRDPRLVEFAEALTHSAFAVLVPDILSFQELRPSPDSAAEIGAAVGYLRTSGQLPPGSRLGVGAFSIAAGPGASCRTRMLRPERSMPNWGLRGGQSMTSSSIPIRNKQGNS